MSIVGGVISILDWLKDKIPIQNRVERWKNERDNLKREREQLLKGQCDEKKAKRLDWINNRISYLEQLFVNASDNK